MLAPTRPSRPQNWLNKFFTSNGRPNGPNGLPLFSYHVVQNEYDELVDLLRATAQLVPITGPTQPWSACFIIFIAEYYRREHEGGWAWSMPEARIGIEFDYTTRTELTLQGLNFWNRPLRINDYLGTLFAEGGLPWRQMHGDVNSFTEAVRAGLKNCHAQESLSNELISRMARLDNTIPAAHQNPGTHELIASIVTELMHLATAVPQLASTDDPISYLDKRVPAWHKRFPIPLSEANGRELIEGWLLDAAGEYQSRQHTKKEHRKTRCRTVLTTELPVWSLKSEVTLPDWIDFELEGDTLSTTRLQLTLHEGDRLAASIGTLYGELDPVAGRIRVTFRKRQFDVERLTIDQPLTLQAYSDDLLVGKLIIDQSDAELSTLPLIFDKDEGDWVLKGATSTTISHHRALLRLPRNLQLPETAAHKIQGTDNQGAVWIELHEQAEIRTLSGTIRITPELSEDLHPPAPKDTPIDDKFSEWNLRLLKSFFSEASAQEEVFLRVDIDFLNQIGQDIGGDKGFLEAVRTGPCWINPNTSLIKAIDLLVYQRKNSTNRRFNTYKDPGELDHAYRDSQAPTYLPYLAALVRNDTVNQGSFYDGLVKDLELRHQFGSSEMSKIEPAWMDLEKWTNQSEGKFGLFKLRILGGYRLIGVPRSQSILKQGDIENLAYAFVQAEVKSGQELTGAEITLIFDELKASDYLYSAAFKSALSIEEFEQPICAAIRSAHEDWDGTIPNKSGSNQSLSNGNENRVSTKSKLGLCLSLVEHEPLTLSPNWWVPALQDTGSFSISHSSSKWEGSFTGTEGSTTILALDKSENIWKIVELGNSEPTTFVIESFPDDGSEPTKSELILPKRQLWILSSTIDGPNGNTLLRESALPGYGSAFLLATPEKNQALKNYLQREQPAYSIITPVGIPEDWLFVRLHECSTLTNDQRLLPDGEETAHPKPRAIRFVGGRSIRRGYSRMYLPYDLPTIELDAPVKIQLKCSPGINLEEVLDEAHSGLHFTSHKKYKIHLKSDNAASYEIQALLDGELYGRAKIRIASLGGNTVSLGDAFSLDNLGEPLNSHDGLSGVLPPQTSDKPKNRLIESEFFNILPSSIESQPIHPESEPCPAELFLDALARAGSINYGVARDQILRLSKSASKDVSPALVLLDLRRRGHIEISLTYKGHISRIHAVPPTVYELPIVSSGKRVYGVTGTLRLSHWYLISNETSVWCARRNYHKTGEIAPLRLLADHKESVQSMCEQLDLRFSEEPALAIANWSSDIETVRHETLRTTIESIGSADEDSMNFNPQQGKFTINQIHRDEKQTLLRVPDLEIGIGHIYVLASNNRYAFVRNSRWGVWIALNSFVKWMAEHTGIKGIAPVPIMYSEKDGTLWLPARIGLPFILERALILCSGDSPETLSIQHAVADSDSDRIELRKTENNAPPALIVNCFYAEMAIGIWLAYRQVPESIARTVIEKLGATPDII